MTEAQRRLYFRKWGSVRKIYRDQGYPPKEADAMRKQLHARAFAPGSSKDFTNQDLDRVLEEFDAILEPDSIPDRVNRSTRARLLHAIQNSGKPPEYIAAICFDKFHSDQLSALAIDELKQLVYTLKNR